MFTKRDVIMIAKEFIPPVLSIIVFEVGCYYTLKTYGASIAQSVITYMSPIWAPVILAVAIIPTEKIECPVTKLRSQSIRRTIERMTDE